MKTNSTSITALPRLPIYKAQDYPELRLKTCEDSILGLGKIPALIPCLRFTPVVYSSLRRSQLSGPDHHHFYGNIQRAAQSRQIRVDPSGFIREGRGGVPFPHMTSTNFT